MKNNKPEFVHLHCHSEYSLLDGANPLSDGKGSPSELLKNLVKMGYKAMALTDHGNMFGAVEFYQAGKKAGLKPIIGMEANMAPKSRFDRDQSMGEAYYHLTLLAANQTGYRNLLKLSSIAFLEGFHYKARIDKDVLRRHSEGLIALSGCLKGEIPSALMKDDSASAQKLAEEYRDIFGKDNFFIEIMRHGLELQESVNPKLVDLAGRMQIPLVATNDCHYFRKDDALAQDVLLCIGTGRKLSEEKRLKFGSSEFYFKSPAEMAALFSDLPEAISSTVAIAERCQWSIDFDRLFLPRYEVPVGQTPESYLRDLCLEGLSKKLGSVPESYRKRLDDELAVINRMGFAPYFLIVWDFIRFARDNHIPVGPGRGSGAGSLVAYGLQITSIDPIENGLLFERFLNPERRSMPDLDIDFSDDGRDQVIQYVRKKYGENCVAQIITFGSMLARGVVRDVGRVLDMPLPNVDKIAGLIPRELGITIDAAMKSSSELNQLYKDDPQVTKLIDLARCLEGMKRHTGVHAAGTVIAAGDITDFVPLAKNNKDIVTTQYDGETLAKMGLLKVDFLGLRTLTVIRDAVQLIRERHVPGFDIEKIPVDDLKAYELLSKADTLGVFQLESSGMKDLLRKLKPSCLSDITALISLYRPGPMGSGMLDDFVARKTDSSLIQFLHPLMEPLLKETYGIIVYQEQVMRIAQVLAGFTPGEADTLRKAMGKKIMEELEKQRGHFVEGAAKNKINEKLSNKIFDLMAHFGGYGFNKSHASAYGLVSYQTAYLKANYPVEYIAALCSNEIGRSTMASKEVESKLVGFLKDAEDHGIEVLLPDIEKSGAKFLVETEVGAKQPKIRFGLTAVKNVGEGAVDSIIVARAKGPFKDLEDFCARVDTRLTNRRVVESLIKAGAFDSLAEVPSRFSRPAFLERVEESLSAADKVKKDAEFASHSLFGEDVLTSMAPNKKAMDFKTEWSRETLLSAEKEVLGFYLSGHPLSQYAGEMTSYTTCGIGHLPESGIVRIAGHVLSVRRMTTKKGNLMARFVLEDLEDEVEITVFPKLLTPETNSILAPGARLVVRGRVEENEFSKGEDSRQVLAEEILALDEARARFIRSLTIKVSTESVEEPILIKLKEVFGRFPGLCRVNLLLPSKGNGPVLLQTKTGVKPSSALVQDLEKVLGPECCFFGKLPKSI